MQWFEHGSVDPLEVIAQKIPSECRSSGTQVYALSKVIDMSDAVSHKR